MQIKVKTSIDVTVLALSPYMDFHNKDTKDNEAQ